MTEPRAEARPDVASPSGSIKPPPAPELPANPPRLPDLTPAGVVPVAPVPADVAPVPADVAPVPAHRVPAGVVIVDGGPDVSPDDDTAPIPVITPDMPKPMPASARAASTDNASMPVTSASAGRIRAPFEPLERKPGPPPAPPPMPEPSSPEVAKLDQIKDLYLTAEAIGEDALDRHFQQVSDRQRQLIREYFDQVTTRSEQGEAES
jgi:hypothetical protein